MRREPGARPVPDYELVHVLGRGGFGEVWKANGPGGFQVALKFIHLEGDIAQVELRSLELMKDIRHPHLLSMFGAWRRDDHLILALELADRALYDRWREARGAGQPGIPAAELVEYMRDAASGLDHLNKLGLQHRDIKPHNILLVGGGAKVSDFGLAKLMEHSIASHTGAMTPAYAAPEFLQGKTSSHSDQYSLAISYCELRGGRLPFAGAPAQVVTGHLMGEPDLSMLPSAERRAVARALAKDPEQRWPSCRAFVAALTVTADEVAPEPAPPPPLPRAAPRPRVVSPRPRAAAGRGRRPEVAEPAPAAAPAATTDAVVNSIGMRLVLVQAGRFTMGSPPDEAERGADEEPRRAVIHRPFYLGAFAVTQEEYERVMGRNPSWFTARGGGRQRVVGLRTARFPVENVSWQEADEYCRRLSALPAEQRAGRVYRLPIEAEWEYACREAGRARGAFHFGASLSSRQANCDGEQPYGGAAPGPYLRRTAAVGSYPPNALGLYDLHGNVFEWCADGYERQPGRRVVRGGAWSYGAATCRCACRTPVDPATRNGNIGFRVACDVGG